MKTTMIAFCLALVSGCGFSNSNMRQRTMTEIDDGVHPVQRMTVTADGNANTISAGLPMGADMMLAGGYGNQFGYGAGSYGGYGLPSVGMVGCSVDPRMCGQWVTTSVVNPTALPTMVSAGAVNGTTTVVVDGGNAPAGNQALAARVDHVEKRVDKIQTVELRNACRQFMKDPSQVADAAKRQKQTDSCKQILSGK